MCQWGTSILTSPTRNRIPSTLSGNTALVGISTVIVPSRMQHFSAFSNGSNGDWPPATRRGTLQHLHSNEIGRAAHARLGSFLQLRCSSWPVKYFCFATRHHLYLYLKMYSVGAIFEGGCVDIFTMVKHIDYPRDRETGNIIAAVHPQLQVWPWFKGSF